MIIQANACSHENISPQIEALTAAVSKMLGHTVRCLSFQAQPLKGGTLGDVRFVTGMAESEDGAQQPYQVVWKRQKKWERPGDPGSWRREYDLYQGNLGSLFTPAFRWPACYQAELRDDQIELWLEYIDGVSGSSLTIEMLEQAALELGRWQGRMARQGESLGNMTCLGDAGFLAREFRQWHTQSFTRDFLLSDSCRLPVFLKEKIKNGDIQLIDGKSLEYSYLRSRACTMPENLKQMIMAIDEHQDEIFARLQNLPHVLCHRDFWHENIFYADGAIRLIDWDTAGWGILGEDLVSLIVDDMAVERLEENYRRLVPAYWHGLAEYMAVPAASEICIGEMILLKFGYRMSQGYIFSETDGGKSWGAQALQKLHDLRLA